jgi:hypothetical protein
MPENVKYSKFCFQGLEFHDELEFIYVDAVATNQHQWTPALGVPFESNVKNTTTNVPQEIIAPTLYQKQNSLYNLVRLYIKCELKVQHYVKM